MYGTYLLEWQVWFALMPRAKTRAGTLCRTPRLQGGVVGVWGSGLLEELLRLHAVQGLRMAASSMSTKAMALRIIVMPPGIHLPVVKKR